jgi:site-specific recombinase XerD
MQVFEEFKEHLAKRYMSPQTIRCYQGDLEEFATLIPDVLNATSEHIKEYLRYSQAKHQPSTTNRKIATLRTFFKWLSRNKGISNPFLGERIPIPKIPLKKRHCLSDQEANSLLDKLKSLSVAIEARDRAICSLILHCGLRVSEVVKLTVGDINPREGCIVVRNPNGKRRKVALGAALPHLGKYLEYRVPSNPDGSKQQLLPLDVLFLNKDGGSLSTRSIRRKIAAAASKAGVQACPRVLRHSFARNFIKSGGGLRQLQELLGHLSHATTSLYTQPAMIEEKTEQSQEPVCV